MVTTTVHLTNNEHSNLKEKKHEEKLNVMPSLSKSYLVEISRTASNK